MRRDEIDNKPPESNSPLDQVAGRDANRPAKIRSQTYKKPSAITPSISPTTNPGHQWPSARLPSLSGHLVR